MYGVQLDITCRRVLWYMPPDFRIAVSLNYVKKSCKCYRDEEWFCPKHWLHYSFWKIYFTALHCRS